MTTESASTESTSTESTSTESTSTESTSTELTVADSSPRFTPGQIVTVFRSRLRSTGGDEYGATADAMLALARERPGFVDFKTFTAPDGERVSLVTFADDESQQDWRRQVDHRAAQAAGRDRFYAEYSIQVCDCTRVHRFTTEA